MLHLCRRVLTREGGGSARQWVIRSGVALARSNDVAPGRTGPGRALTICTRFSRRGSPRRDRRGPRASHWPQASSATNGGGAAAERPRERVRERLEVARLRELRSVGTSVSGSMARRRFCGPVRRGAARKPRTQGAKRLLDGAPPRVAAASRREAANNCRRVDAREIHSAYRRQARQDGRDAALAAR